MMKISKIIVAGLFLTAFFSCKKTEYYNPYVQLQEDVSIIDKYLEDHNIDAKKSSTGLRYVIHDEGIGSSPVAGNLLKVNYTGWLLDGTKFDSSYDRGEPFTFYFGANQVISGWDEGLGYIGERGKITLYVPSSLAYGNVGSGDIIPPNANLIFDIELISVQ